MSSKHIETKHKLQEIKEVKDFESLLSQAILSEESKQLLRMIYVEHRQMDYIADVMGVSLQTVKARHRKALSRIAGML